MRDYSDDDLIRAARKRILRELNAQKEAAQISNVINNHQGGQGGLMEAMNGGAQGPSGEDPYDYLVDIEKKDIPGEAGGKAIGWTKKVHRHRSPKGSLGE